jgi:hypothetical protein
MLIRHWKASHLWKDCRWGSFPKIDGEQFDNSASDQVINSVPTAFSPAYP